MLELEEQLPQLQMHPIGHLFPALHLFHYKLVEVPIDMDRAPEVSTLITSIDVNHSFIL